MINASLWDLLVALSCLSTCHALARMEGVMKNAKTEEVERAIETYDHLLWESVARICEQAFSQAFQKQGHAVRVVYKTTIDPRECFEKIKEEVGFLISKELPVRKLGRRMYWLREIEGLCSRIEYFNLRQLSTREIFSKQVSDDFHVDQIDCDFVMIGIKDKADYICCPCLGQHLDNTRQLQQVEIKLQRPSKVGKNNFEFRFEIY